MNLLDYGVVRMLALERAEIFVIISSQLFLYKTTKDKSYHCRKKVSVIEEEEIYFIKKKTYHLCLKTMKYKVWVNTRTPELADILGLAAGNNPKNTIVPYDFCLFLLRCQGRQSSALVSVCHLAREVSEVFPSAEGSVLCWGQVLLGHLLQGTPRRSTIALMFLCRNGF